MGLIRLLLLAALVYIVFRLLTGYLTQKNSPRPRVAEAGRTSGTASTPHEVLGVAADASQDEIKSAYQRLIRQYHPDRVADMGPEIREVAERRAKEINAAYEQLRKP